MKKQILIIDDNISLAQTISDILNQNNYSAEYIEDEKKIEEVLLSKHWDLILCDLKLKTTNGISILKKSNKLNLNMPFIIITGHGGVSEAVEAMKQGAADFILKPLDKNRILAIVSKNIQADYLTKENIILKQKLEDAVIIGENKEFLKAMDLAKQVSATDSTILIEGPTGSGKEVMANFIHKQSSRKENPLVILNCAAISENLIESELFGHLKGSFTNAYTNRTGKFMYADKSSLFLDEVSEIPLNVQAKLLRAVEYKSFSPIGSEKELISDVRIISATNKNLNEMVENKKFREDLYFRLCVVKIKLPGLKERKDDIPLFIKYFINFYNKKFNKDIKKINESTLKKLIHYTWPGNIRELKNCLERSILLSKKDILGDDDFSFLYVKNKTFDNEETIDFENKVSSFEKKIILDALRICDFNKAQAAKFLNLSRQNLQYKIEKYKINI